ILAALAVDRDKSEARDAGDRMTGEVVLAGAGPQAPVDCLLEDGRIVFLSRRDQSEIAAVDFEDAAVRAAGAASAFVLYTPSTGPLSVVGASDVLSRRLLANPRLTKIAQSTLKSGPYPVRTGPETPAICRFEDEELVVESAGAVFRAGYDALGAPNVTIKDEDAFLELASADPSSSVTLLTRVELAEKIETSLLAERLAAGGRDHAPDLLRAAVGLEEDWLLSVIAGPSCLMHSALLTAAQRDGADLSTPAPEDAGSPAFAAVMAAGLDDLRTHFEMVANVLPSFITAQDRRIVSAAGGSDEWLKPAEAGLRAALSPALRAALDIVQIRSLVWRVADLNPENLPKTDFTGAALTAVVGGAINPMLVVGALSQAGMTHSAGEERTRLAAAAEDRAMRQIIFDWNRLFHEVLPPLMHALVDAVFPQRWEAARMLEAAVGDAADPAPGLRALQKRVAALDARRRYPVEPGVQMTRADIAAHVRASLRTLAYPRFTEF
ncbi:MAG: hypothetical protein AAF360_07205, partial [Pseudomonadota bacterium]